MLGGLIQLYKIQVTIQPALIWGLLRTAGICT